MEHCFACLAFHVKNDQCNKEADCIQEDDFSDSVYRQLQLHKLYTKLACMHLLSIIDTNSLHMAIKGHEHGHGQACQLR